MINHPAYTMGVHDGMIEALRLIEPHARQNSRIVHALHKAVTTQRLQFGNQKKGTDK